MEENQSSSQIKTTITANFNAMVKGASKIAKDFLMVAIGIGLVLVIFFFGEWITGRAMISVYIANSILIFFMLFGVAIIIARFLEEKERIKCISP